MIDISIGAPPRSPMRTVTVPDDASLADAIEAAGLNGPEYRNFEIRAGGNHIDHPERERATPGMTVILAPQVKGNEFEIRIKTR